MLEVNNLRGDAMKAIYQRLTETYSKVCLVLARSLSTLFLFFAFLILEIQNARTIETLLRSSSSGIVRGRTSSLSNDVIATSLDSNGSAGLLGSAVSSPVAAGERRATGLLGSAPSSLLDTLDVPPIVLKPISSEHYSPNTTEKTGVERSIGYVVDCDG